MDEMCLKTCSVGILTLFTCLQQRYTRLRENLQDFRRTYADIYTTDARNQAPHRVCGNLDAVASKLPNYGYLKEVRGNCAKLSLDGLWVHHA